MIGVLEINHLTIWGFDHLNKFKLNISQTLLNAYNPQKTICENL